MSLSINVEAVTRAFGGITAVRDVSFRVEPGSAAGLIGPNGAGKTTMFNLITGVIPPTSGSITIGGKDVRGLGVDGAAALGVARTFQTPRAFPKLSVVENVEVMYEDPREGLWGALFGRGSNHAFEDQAMAVLERVGLADLARRTTEELSGGQLRMLEIARQLARDPKLLMLDEPTAGLDRAHQDQLSGILSTIRESGVTVLLVEHNLRFLFENVDFVQVMSVGELIASGKPELIAKDETVINAYLGRVDDASARA